MGEDKEKKGRHDGKYQVDENLSNGPTPSRSCNDILCCLLFLANIAAIIGIGAYGLNKGHPDRLLVGYDSQKRACGKDSLEDYPYVYLTSLLQLERSICLKACPNEYLDQTLLSGDEDTAIPKATEIWEKMEYLDTAGALKKTGVVALNIASYKTYKADIIASEEKYLTRVVVYQTKGFFKRVCLPYGEGYSKVLEDVGNAFGSSTTSLEKYIADVKTAWGMILGSVGIAFVVALIYMVILRYFAGLLTWVSIILYFGAIIALAILLLQKGKDKEDEGIQDNDKETEQDGKNLKYLSYAVFAFAGLCAIVFLCLFNRIRLAIAIIKSAALFVAEVKSVFLVPPVITIVNMLFMAWWIVAFVFVYSVGEIQGSENGPFASVKWEKNTRYMLAYHIFGGLWINAFFNSLIQFVLATACVLWYFSKPNEPHRPVYTGLVRGLTYHFGSLAFGSLLLAIIQFIRLVLEYIDRQAEAAGQKENKVAKCILSYMKCLAACFQRFIEFINKNAYIQIALTGKNFCLAAKDAFYLIWCNPAKFGIIATIGGVFIFIGRIFIACITGLISYIILIKATYYKENLFSPILPAVFCTIIGYFIGTFFMSVYGMGVDTILQCTCLDEELMKKTGKDPNRCPGPLKDFFEGQAKEKN